MWKFSIPNFSIDRSFTHEAQKFPSIDELRRREFETSVLIERWFYNLLSYFSVVFCIKLFVLIVCYKVRYAMDNIDDEDESRRIE